MNTDKFELGYLRFKKSHWSLQQIAQGEGKIFSADTWLIVFYSSMVLFYDCVVIKATINITIQMAQV